MRPIQKERLFLLKRCAILLPFTTDTQREFAVGVMALLNPLLNCN